MIRTSLTLTLLMSLGVALPTPAHADESRLWVNGSGSVSAGTSWRVTVEGSYRLTDSDTSPDQKVVRVTVEKKLGDNLAIGGGAGYFDNELDGAIAPDETRLHQQASVRVAVPIIASVDARARLEERFFDGSDDVGLRARGKVKLNGPPLVVLPFRPVASAEIFVNANDTDYGAQSGVDQTRLMLGVETSLIPLVKLEAGYMREERYRPGDNPVSNTAVVGLNVKL